MTTAQRLQQAAAREAALQDAAVAAYEAEVRRVWAAVTRQLRGLLGTWQTDRRGRTLTSAINLTRVLALRRRVRDLMRAEGYDRAAVSAVGAPLEALAEAAIRSQRIANQAIRFAPASLEALEAWRTIRLADLLDIAEDAARAVQRAALDGVLGLRPIERLLLDIVDVLDLSARQARTLYDTAVSVFSRQMEMAATTGAPDELFVYVGPADAKTRPFCRRWVGRVLDRAAIEPLDNEQLPDTLLTGGGYNCRHQWKRVSVLDDELRALHASGQRATWVQAQLRQVAA